MAQDEEKLKVCIVSAILPPAYGGAEVAAFKYAKRLRERDDSQILVIGWDRTGAYEKSNEKFDFVHSVRFPENPKDAKGILIYFQQYNHMWHCFWSLIGPMWRYRKKYDYIHNFNSGFAFNRISILIGKMLGKKVITETSLVGDDDPLSLGRFPNWTDYLKPKLVRYLFYKMADRYVSKSAMITEIFKKSEIQMSKVAEVPYSVDIEQFRPVSTEEKRILREKLALWKDGKIILFVGGINVRKGVHLLLEAFIAISSEHPDVKLLIAGPTYKYDPKYITDLKERIRSSGLSERIRIKEENVSNVNEYMMASNIFVLPSRQEGFPISILEAMSCGLNVIGSDIPEISKVQIDDDVNGNVFKSGNATELAKVLNTLLRDEETSGKLRLNARDKAAANWSTKKVDESYRSLYRSIR